MGFKTIHITAGNACGKTLSAIATAKMLLQTNPQYEHVLIAAPEGLPDFFETELRTDLRDYVTVTVVETVDQIPERTKYDLVVDDLFSQLTRHPLLQYIRHGGCLIETHVLAYNKTLRDALYGKDHNAKYKVTSLKHGIQACETYNSTRTVMVELASDTRTMRFPIVNFSLNHEGVRAALKMGFANQRVAGSLEATPDLVADIIKAGRYEVVPSQEIVELVRDRIYLTSDNNAVKQYVLDTIDVRNRSSKTKISEEINVAITMLRNAR